MKVLLHKKLEFHYNAFDKTSIEPDPLQFLHRYKNPNDIEIVGLISSVFAFGNVKVINNKLEEIFNRLGKSPYNKIKNLSLEDSIKISKGLSYRFYTDEDIAELFFLLKLIIKNYGSLKNLFLLGYNPNDKNLKNAVSSFSQNCISILIENKFIITNGIRFMFSNPKTGSASKRFNLFLRWMIRKDELDFGLWNEIPTNKLVIPVDTHIAKISFKLGLTKRKNINWKTAEEITENLKKYDSVDPVKYDFALCHIGMRKLSF